MVYPNIVFGSSGLIGLSVIKYCAKKKIEFIHSSRNRPDCSNIKWISLDLNRNLKNFKYKKFNIGIFLSSPSYLKKNLNYNKFNKEFYWLQKVTNSFIFSKFIYVSSSSVYYKKHPIGKVKKKCEKYLQKNKHKFKYVQIWRPFNLVGTKQKTITDHFHNLLFKLLFIKKLKKCKFKGNENDIRGYSDVNEFVKIMLKESRKKKSFTRNFGNPQGIKLKQMLKIFNKEYFKRNKVNFIAEFNSKYPNKNLISNRLKNSFFSNKSSKNVINNYLIEMLNAQKK